MSITIFSLLTYLNYRLSPIWIVWECRDIKGVEKWKRGCEASRPQGGAGHVPATGGGRGTLIGDSSMRRGRNHNFEKRPSKKETDHLTGRSAF